MVARPQYMERLRAYKDGDLVKVVTGLRRCGKSTLLLLFKQELLASGVDANNIIDINFELMEFDEIRDYRRFYDLVRGRIPRNGKCYLLLDEIQQVAGWEKAVNSLCAETDIDADVYITGSNAYLLSSDIATLLSGRYVEIKMLPLSFKEFLLSDHLPADMTVADKFRQYLKYGSLPAVTALPQEEPIINEFLLGIYNTVVVKDIVARSGISDVWLLEKIMRYVISNTGNIISSNKISGFLSAQGRGENLKSSTVASYLDALKRAFIVYQADRCDIKGKEQLKTLAKYYVADTGIRNALAGYSDGDIGHVLESVVYFELLRRGYRVFVGKWFDSEVDFLAIRQDTRKYYQVTLSMADESVRKRELAPLAAIKDNYEKTVLSMDKTYITDHEGILFRNIIDFLLSE
ncbi:MAG: ATP-binding protein [Oscillospiraceae bacterium]|jgi:predicted AAA+ superfamily ATPase|nr:ATP-binding protein [Oscillospiraceae bacterium]